MNTATETAIREYIDGMQRGKSGIYPYRVAEAIALHFHVTVAEATPFVLDHIRRESAKAIHVDASQMGMAAKIAIDSLLNW